MNYPIVSLLIRFLFSPAIEGCQIYINVCIMLFDRLLKVLSLAFFAVNLLGVARYYLAGTILNFNPSW